MSLRNFSSGMEIVYEDLNNLSKALLKDIYDSTVYHLVQKQDDAFFSDSFKVNYSNASTVILKKGLGFQKVTATSPEIERLPIVLEADQTLSLQTPDGTNPRIDLICVKSNLIDELTETRKYKSPLSVISNESFVTQKKFSSSVLVVVGTPAAVPVAPAVPTGYISVSSLAVAALTGLASQASITDSRSIFSVGPDTKIDTTLFTRLTQLSNYNLAALLKEIDGILPKASVTSTIANNIAGLTDITNFNFSFATKSKFVYEVGIRRKTDSQEFNSIGTITVLHNSVTDTVLCVPNLLGDDCEVDISAILVSGSQWKLQYKSSNIAGINYLGQMSFKLITEF